jgi:hypothetical protein
MVNLDHVEHCRFYYCLKDEIGLEEPCFKKEGSNPPACGVHNVSLIKKHLPNELIASGHEGFTFLACPVSGTVLNDEAGRQKGTTKS